NMYAKSITEQVRRAVSYYKKGISAKNSRNGELYRIEFFTHFSPAFNIVKTMASDLEKFSSSDLNNILQCACGQQKTLSECIANR
ncbi:MAG: hypothetical protein KKG59_00605, partial [Nanoarchaeota archaeon]|nr:hypothetical protein [Nanoarchaeota archaeon]